MFSLFVLSLINLLSFSSPDHIVIADIVIHGNRHTRAKTILREMDIAPGDSIAKTEITTVLNFNKNRILSTGLFNFVDINVTNYSPEKNTAEIRISVEENWYIFPVPVFELADRNFSVWWDDQDRALNRVNYGGRISHYNLTGHRDPLKLKIHFGYTSKYELDYLLSQLPRNRNIGMGVNVFYSQNKEIGYQTRYNKTQFYRHPDERNLLSRFRLSTRLLYRPKASTAHVVKAEYHHNSIDPFVARELNADYFFNNKEALKFLSLSYSFALDNRVYAQYPRGGYSIFASVKKEGLGLFNDIDNLSLTAGFEKHFNFRDRYFFSNRIKGKVNLNRNIVPFANNTGLGWDTDIVSGYELYVLDGTDYFVSMHALKWEILERNIKTYSWLPVQFQKMNIAFFLRFNMDWAYVYEPTYTQTNGLNNRIIYGFGPAMDIILFNNFLLSFEYSFNDIGEKGLYFHNTIAF